MRVVTKVHESVIDQIKPRLPVRIRVDAFPGQVFTGTVQSVALLPDLATAGSRDARVFAALVTIDGRFAGLRPGMTAQAAIVVGERDNVLSVPLAAVDREAGKDRVLVQKPGGGLAWRDVILGATDGARVEIVQGIQGSERVLLDARALAGSQERATMRSPE
jgi:HlyD family secretion protein